MKILPVFIFLLFIFSYKSKTDEKKAVIVHSPDERKLVDFVLYQNGEVASRAQ